MIGKESQVGEVDFSGPTERWEETDDGQVIPSSAKCHAR